MKRLSIITILLAVLCIPVKANESATYIGWVRSMWRCSSGTHVLLVFEPSDNSASITMEFERVPPVWQGEHVSMKLEKLEYGAHENYWYKVIEVRRLK